MKIGNVVFAAKGTVRAEEGALDTRLGARQVLVKTRCSMVSQGTELAALTSTHTRCTDPNPPAWLKFPSVPGYLMCGEVVERGAEVSELAVGDRVIAEGRGCWNSHVSHLVADVSEWLTKVPEGVSDEEAAASKLASVAMYGVRVLGHEFGESVAVFGLGFVGQLVIRFCSLAGFRQIVAVDPVACRRAKAADVPGVTVVAPDSPLVGAEMAARSREQGYDNVIEASGHSSAFLQALSVARIRGRVSIPSAPHQPVQLKLYDQVMNKSLQILGAHGSSQPFKATHNDRWNEPRQKEFYLELLAKKRMDVKPLFTHRASWREAPAMYEQLLRDAREHLGVVFEW